MKCTCLLRGHIAEQEVNWRENLAEVDDLWAKGIGSLYERGFRYTPEGSSLVIISRAVSQETGTKCVVESCLIKQRLGILLIHIFIRGITKLPNPNLMNPGRGPDNEPTGSRYPSPTPSNTAQKRC